MIPPEALPAVAKGLTETVALYIERGYRSFVAGGARGFDTLAAQTVLHLRLRYPEVKLILVLPYEAQTRGLKQSELDEYLRIKAAADKVVYISRDYTRGCLHRRNRYMVDISSLCICYLTENKGGTAFTVDYAKKQGLPVINTAYCSALAMSPDADHIRRSS